LAQSNEYSTIILSRRDEHSVQITLNRPDLHNAFNETLIAELSECFKSLGQDETVQLIILTGEGKSFCAGADINWMKSMVAYSREENLKDSQNLADMFKIINECPKPVIGRINGSAFGGGVGLVAVCDIAVAVDSAKFSFSEVKLGIIPAVVSPYVLKKIGPGHARQLFITGERFDSQTAQNIGLIHRTAKLEDIDEKIDETVKMLSANGPRAMHEVKLLISNWYDLNEESYRKYTVEKIAELRTAPEGHEGLEAFLAKRKPSWGRS
jgi:methylglutaconyl-CoA hydratase